MKKAILLPLFILSLSIAAYSNCLLPAPGNLLSTGQTSCTISLSWNPVIGAVGYNLRYKLKNTNTWIKVNVGNNISCTISNLIAGSVYKIGIASRCSDNTVGVYGNTLSVKTASCSLPQGLAVTNVTSSTASLTWLAACSASGYILRYKKTSVNSWTKIGNITATSHTITGLAAQVNYEAQVRSTCNADTSKWTSSVFFTTSATSPSHPNIVMIILDDARYDAFKPTGGPSFLNYPSIDRIANEGVNFRYFYPTSSQCTPSRGTILTGLYAHKHGAFANGNVVNPNLPQIQEILHDNGYFTGVIGKYSFSNYPVGCDWSAVSTNLDYIDPSLYTNGVKIAYTGHVTDVYTKLLGKFFDSIPANQPFMLLFWPITPHGPSIPRDQDTLLYVNNMIPFPSNFNKYQHNYPGYYYNNDHSWNFNASQTDSLRLIEYQTQQGSELNVDTILTRLENMGVLDSTLVIFASDNGYLKGEHLMGAKQVALEESIRVPLFVRYPAWFAAHSLVTDEIASNMDLAPTILEVANIPDTYNMDGISLHQLYNGNITRKDFYYEYCSQEASPPIRAVRSFQYKYVYTFCDQTTEEFYDLTTDPNENTNQVFNPAYASLIQQYRNKKDSFRLVFNDTISDMRHCSLAKIQMKEDADLEDADVNALEAFPSPASQTIRLQWLTTNKENAVLTIKNEIGQIILRQNFSESGWKNLSVDCSTWQEGMYFADLSSGRQIRSCKMMVMH